MNPLRLLIAGLIIVLGIVVLKWLFAEPSITLNLKEAPLANVLKEFERQGKIRIASNLDPSKTVTLYFEKTPVFDALETLAARVDGSWRLAYLAAPKTAQIDVQLKAFVNKDTLQPSWNSYQLRTGGASEAAIDPRTFVWEVSPSESKELTHYLAQAAQKTPAFFATPPDWNPLVNKPPASGPLKKTIPQLIRLAGGNLREVILLEARSNWRPEGEVGNSPPATEGAPVDLANREPRRDAQPSLFAQSLRRDQSNPEWVAQRAETALQLLPAEEQTKLREEMKEMRALMEQMRQLPAEERRAKMEELMNDPKIAERMEQRTASRESRLSPSQRVERSKRYVENKLKARAEAGRPMGPTP